MQYLTNLEIFWLLMLISFKQPGNELHLYISILNPVSLYDTKSKINQ